LREEITNVKAGFKPAYLALLPFLGLALAACGAPADAPEADDSGSTAATVTFTSPEAGATVTSPFEVCLETTGVTIQPAGDGTVVEGTGHHHIIVDPSTTEMTSIMAGDPVVLAKDETHIHQGDGASCVMVTAEPGDHVLLAVVADASHTALNPPVTAELAVTVGP
jgi:hypothetical protein